MNYNPGKFLKNHWALFAATVIFLLILAIVSIQIISINHGLFIYPLDDTYIHMSMAKNLAEHGVWGVTQHAFSNSSSSPLWTLSLAAIFFIFGINTFLPFILNVLLALILIFRAYFFLLRFVKRPIYIFTSLMLIIITLPLPVTAITGMEHVMHALLSIWLLDRFTKVLDKSRRRGDLAMLMLLAGLITMARYESLFLLFAMSVVLFIKKEKKAAGAIMLSGSVLPAFYGLFSIMKGWYLLPNGVMLKGNRPEFELGAIIKYFSGYSLSANLYDNPYILVLILISMLTLLYQATKDSQAFIYNALPVVFIITALMHFQFAASGWWFRYEAYLAVLGIVVITIQIQRLGLVIPNKEVDALRTLKIIMAVVLIVLLSYPAANRTVISLKNTARASNDIYLQQYQMARFLARYYSGKTVALNDIGCTTFYTGIKLTDLYGLGTMATAEARLKKEFNTMKISAICDSASVEIAVVYDSWYDRFGGLPKHWHKTGDWSLNNTVIAGGSKVSFYGLNQKAYELLHYNLWSFSKELPGEIIQDGYLVP